MCGFAGVVAWDERYRVTRETMKLVSARIAHRGPDGQGLYLSPEAAITPEHPQVALAHRRLAIIDPDPRANQPFTDHAGRWIVFNGEIYNFRELRLELGRLQPDYEWHTYGDTETLLVAYVQWGEKCVERLNGMFAFAVWDDPRKRLFLARDRMGQKPLYLAKVFNSKLAALSQGSRHTISAVAFASERPALDVLPWVDRRFSEANLAHYLRFGYVEEWTQLAPATVTLLNCQTQGYEGHRYFQHSVRGPAEKEWARQPVAALVAETRRLVTQAVSRQLVSDVPLGCFLSGGIDSSIIAACMKASSPADQPVMTFSIAFDDPRYDESPFAAAVASHLGTVHQAFHVRPRAIEDLPALAAVFGDPFADSSALPTHYLARETRRFVKVALSGDGGDELFGGYDRYRAMALTERLHGLPNPLRKVLLGQMPRRILAMLPGTHPKSHGARFKRLLASIELDAPRRYLSYMQIFDDGLIRDLLGHEPQLPDGPWRYLNNAFEHYARSRDVVQAALAADRERYLPGDLLTKLDRASMLHALEVRSPFMDHELVRFAANLSTPQLLQGGPKRMLREAFARDLPPWVFKRKKMGFAVPIGDWFRGELKPMLHDHLFAAESYASSHFQRAVLERLVNEHQTHRHDHSQRLYALLMLELWWRRRKG